MLKINSYFEPMLNYFWTNKQKIMSDDFGANFWFDTSDYAGLPKDISKHLTLNITELIQAELILILTESTTKNQFKSNMAQLLSNGLIK